MKNVSNVQKARWLSNLATVYGHINCRRICMHAKIDSQNARPGQAQLHILRQIRLRIMTSPSLYNLQQRSSSRYIAKIDISCRHDINYKKFTPILFICVKFIFKIKIHWMRNFECRVFKKFNWVDRGRTKNGFSLKLETVFFVENKSCFFSSFEEDGYWRYVKNKAGKSLGNLTSVKLS